MEFTIVIFLSGLFLIIFNFIILFFFKYFATSTALYFLSAIFNFIVNNAISNNN